jgi:uncharacterized membrane protein
MDKLKKPKTGTALFIQKQVTKLAEMVSTFASRKLSEVTINEVMEHVLIAGRVMILMSITLPPSYL